MRDDAGSPLARPARAVRERGLRALALGALALAAGSPAAADSFHGAAELQYQSVEPAPGLSTLDSWAKIFQMDYGSRLPGSIEMSSNFRFVEQTVARQLDRVRVPEGRVRLAHTNFGLSAGYRPTEARDARGFLTRQQDLTLTANAQKPGLPSVAGSWVRTHRDPTALSAGTSTIARNLSTQYAVPHASFRAGYGDRSLDDATRAGPRMIENHVSLGSSSQFQVGRAPVSFQYDFSQGRVNPSFDASRLARAHIAGLSTGFPIDPRTSTSLSYNYRRTQVVGMRGSLSQEHNGTLSAAHTFNSVLGVSAGAGVRSAILAGGTQNERFVSTSATAQGRVRPGWQLSGAATHSINWLPGSPARPADNLTSSTSMRLARGLDFHGDVSISTAKPVVVPPETTAFLRQVGLQSSAGIVANPLRTVSLDASLSHSRASRSLFGGGISANSYSTGLRLTPYPTMQLAGRWGLTESRANRGTTGQASLQWALWPSLQVSGSYNRARQEISAPSVGFASRQESLNAAVMMRLARELNASVEYSESNRGLPNRVRQLTAHVVRRFGN